MVQIMSVESPRAGRVPLRVCHGRSCPAVRFSPRRVPCFRSRKHALSEAGGMVIPKGDHGSDHVSWLTARDPPGAMLSRAIEPGAEAPGHLPHRGPTNSA